MRVFFYIIVTILAGCTGNLPSQGKLPSLDGSSLSGVKASYVGTASAEEVQAAVQSISAASSESGPSTLVKRDAAGNFSGTLVGSSTYSLGIQGADINPAPALTLGSDGNVFAVIDDGGNTIISSLSDKPNGSRVLLKLPAGLTLKNSNSLQLAGLGDFKTAANDIFEFLSLGSGNWRELTRETNNDSRIFVEYATSPLAPSGSTLRFDLVNEDTQGEYTVSDGKVHLHQSGTYDVHAVVALIPDAGWPVGSICQASFVFDSGGASYAGTPNFPTVNVAACYGEISFSAALTANTTFHVTITYTDAASHHVQPLAGGFHFSRMTVIRR